MKRYSFLHLRVNFTVKKTVLLLSIYWMAMMAAAQPGNMPEKLRLRVFHNGEEVLKVQHQGFIVEWRHPDIDANAWKKALVLNSEFITTPIYSYLPVEIKIYQLNRLDTMFITSPQSLLHIPFQPGRFVLDKSMAYLASMQTFNGTRIVNQDWNNFRATPAAALPVLKKQRYHYIPKELTQYDEEDPEEDVINAGYQLSAHLRIEDEEDIVTYITLGKMYQAPKVSSHVYMIGYVDEGGEDEKYSQYFLESADGCRSWRIKFPLPETDAELVNIKGDQFIFSITYPNYQLLRYNNAGRLIDTTVVEEDPCSMPDNIFYPCEDELKKTNQQGVEYSDPMMDNSSNPHLYHHAFTHNGSTMVRIDEQPFHPNRISQSADGGQNWKPMLDLNAGDTYAYITMRKNKLVVVSYNYTLVSRDFGRSWIFYKNGTFTGGDWNFIWLDDNTLVNVTNYYADVMRIL